MGPPFCHWFVAFDREYTGLLYVLQYLQTLLQLLHMMLSTSFFKALPARLTVGRRMNTLMLN